VLPDSLVLGVDEGPAALPAKSRRLGIKELPTPDGIIEKRLLSFLTAGLTRSIPQKLSTNLRHFLAFRYKSELQTNLRALAELLLEDVVSTEAIRAQFFRECYCDTGELSRDALVSEQILRARYAAMFAESEDAPRLEPAAVAGAVPSLSNQIVAEALAFGGRRGREDIIFRGFDICAGATGICASDTHLYRPWLESSPGIRHQTPL
jgi:hypothetical protein